MAAERAREEKVLRNAQREAALLAEAPAESRRPD